MRLIRVTLSLVVPLALTACIGEWDKNYDTMKRPDPMSAPYETQVPQPNQPDLDPKRTVSDQDCNKPVDPAAGNLRCR